MRDSVGLESYQPGTGRVGGHRIIGEHDLPQETSGADQQLALRRFVALGHNQMRNRSQT